MECCRLVVLFALHHNLSCRYLYSVLFFFKGIILKKLKAIEPCWQALEPRYYLIINPAIVKALN